MEWKIGVRRQGAQKTSRARALRHTETDAERKFWSCVRDRRFLGLKFRRQVPFGPFYLDFYCAERKLAVELDGGGHYEKSGKASDERRDAQLKFLGIQVKRYSDTDALRQIEAVLEDLRLFVLELNPHPNPLLFKERERLNSSCHKILP